MGAGIRKKINRPPAVITLTKRRLFARPMAAEALVMASITDALR
jgi:hypothetical protein